MMYKLLSTIFMNDSSLALILAAGYMLSGFTAGSSQWPFYLTILPLFPLLCYASLQLFQKPSLKYAGLFAFAYYLFFTSLHVYLSIVGSYIIAAFFCLKFAYQYFSGKKLTSSTFIYVLLAAVFTLLLIFFPLYYSLEVLPYLDRSTPLQPGSSFSQSNYLPPSALGNLLLPLSAIKSSYPNTEGTVIASYMGVLPLLLLPIAFFSRSQNWKSGITLLFALCFLVLSFGDLTPLRGILNYLPGLSYFRHPGLLRYFFIFGITIFLAINFNNIRLNDILALYHRHIKRSLIFLLLICTGIAATYAPSLFHAWRGSANLSISFITHQQLTGLSALIQLATIVGLLLTLKRKSLFAAVLLFNIVLNTFFCLPFFTVSSYTFSDIKAIQKASTSFGIQSQVPSDVRTDTIDGKGNPWKNINIFRQEVSTKQGYTKPIEIKQVAAFLSTSNGKTFVQNKTLVFVQPDSQNYTARLKIVRQLPDKVIIETDLPENKTVTLLQANFPGWSATYNQKPLPLIKAGNPFLNCVVPGGKGILEFRYSRPLVMGSSIILHITIIIVSFLMLFNNRHRIKYILP